MKHGIQKISIVLLAGAALTACSGATTEPIAETSANTAELTKATIGPGMSTTVAYNQAETSHYDVVSRKEAIMLDGKLDDSVWAGVADISGSFHYPWEMVEAPLTVFKAYHNADNFYFSFAVTDREVLASEEWKDESTVDNEDRVELFFAGGSVDKPSASGMVPYYATEVDPMGRAHDYSIVYYRAFDSNWTLEGAEYAAMKTDTGYTVEGIIPMKTLHNLKLINEKNIMRTGVFRAEFSKGSGSDIEMQWISWVDPKTENPDFHVDSAFGEFRFIN